MFNGRKPDAVLVVDDVVVASWSPDKEPGGPLTQVHLLVTIPDVELTLVTRLKSRRVVDELIAALIDHRDHVWPT